MYTTSSCSGRIVLITGSQPWNKRDSRVLAKWHDGASYEEVLELVRSHDGDIWLILQSPILHVMCKEVDLAVGLIRLARNCGFRYSTILSKGDHGFLVELMGSERLDVPITLDGERVVGERELKVLIEYMNLKLKSSKTRITRLRKALLRYGSKLKEDMSSSS